MPFTGSHPAAILPLIGRRLPASALVIGTLVPDLPYYFTMPVSSVTTHSLSGAFRTDLVLGGFLFVLWHTVLVQPLVWIAPAAFQRRIPSDLRCGLARRLSTAKDLGLVCLALVLGGLTHIALDLFTHGDTWPVQNIDALSTPVVGLPLYRWLHLALSLLGLALLAWYLAGWWRRAPLVGTAVESVRPGVRWWAAGLLLGISTLAGVRAALAWMPGTGQGTLIAGLLGFFSTLALGVVVCAAAWHVVVGARHDAAAERAPGGRSPYGSEAHGP